ncbi:peroxiredoxin family protein [Adhaeribacter rhizoryzae]|uniref:TlpA family protein disulfide reductase n=1 Tax=Adhaeribacter rhizoryzae TaxID=2607907 RepID=A0A5M6DSX6_9BACT|nr:TlpA disulfide reductase family protein [Adhaeribacter rhizoryzae]KAA5549352.1 TlpA family protein disulfide reductase [Adhaeribacter rhizoryzae]
MNNLFKYISAGVNLGLLILFAAACQPKNKTLKPGTWRGVLTISNQELPFLLEVTKNQTGKTIAYLVNGSEKILLDEITVTGDSVKIPLHIFDADLKAHINNQEDGLKGQWIRYNLDEPYEVEFSAKHDQQYRFSRNPAAPTQNYTGKWDVVFKDEEGIEEKAIGVFTQQGNHLSGTFLSATGDYRYLDGEVSGDELRLSTFDGSHAYLFKASPNGEGKLQGNFFSGKTGRSTWLAMRNENAVLPAADTLTYLKPGYSKLDFTFPDLNGTKVSLADPQFKGKVVVLQLMGSWCPNCMDETAYLAPFYNQNKNKGLEIIGLAYEQNPEFEKAKKRLEKLKSRFGINYPLLVAGTRDKESAAKTLPMLNHVMAFPTTIILDKKGAVRKIHTGFSGPGTGHYYEEFVQDFEKTIQKLLQE